VEDTDKKIRYREALRVWAFQEFPDIVDADAMNKYKKEVEAIDILSKMDSQSISLYQDEFLTHFVKCLANRNDTFRCCISKYFTWNPHDSEYYAGYFFYKNKRYRCRISRSILFDFYVTEDVRNARILWIKHLDILELQKLSIAESFAKEIIKVLDEILDTEVSYE
jgi:hypothetical protein